HPAEFGLVTQTAYDTAVATATVSGREMVLLSPSAYGLVSTSELNSSVSEALASGITQGKEYVQNNLSEFNLVAKSDVELTASRVSGLSAGWTLVSTPFSITDLSVFDSASVVWVYNNATASWSAYSSNATTRQKIIDSPTVNLLTTIPAGSGVWVQK
ncbi:MAG: hypothetical protein IE887_07500, partial [Campylobacterales bacterium]|nr:hypothetical protein [Campylobacterales bacterium]